jgi:hypothetical protein
MKEEQRVRCSCWGLIRKGANANTKPATILVRIKASTKMGPDEENTNHENGQNSDREDEPRRRNRENEPEFGDDAQFPA